jgi:hypothetical protein
MRCYTCIVKQIHLLRIIFCIIFFSAAFSMAQSVDEQATVDQPTVDQPAVESSSGEATPHLDESDVVAPRATEESENTKPKVTLDPSGTDQRESHDGENSKNRICNCRYTTETPYSERRSWISGFFGFMAGIYSPTNYVPDFSSRSQFNNFYDQPNPNGDLVFGAKINFFLGSIGPQFSAGMYSAQSSTANAKLNLNMFTAGLIYSMDNIFKEPYVVPYGVFGLYKDLYTETVDKLSVTGFTPIASFYSVGLMFQLDWIDPETHASGYSSFGLENTFLFLEGRSFLPASNLIADLSSPLQFNGGFRIEF